MNRARGLDGEARRGYVHLVGDVSQSVVVLGNGRCAEGVGLDDVGAGLQVLLVDVANDVRSRQHEQVVVAPEVDRMAGEAFAAKTGLRQLVVLDHGPHRAVQDQDAAREDFAKAGLGG